MGVVQGQRKSEFHPTKRKQVMAAADVQLQQVQVVDKNGQMRPVVVWRCGTDVMFAETMDGLTDSARRFKAPKWLIEQLDALPPSRRFDYMGVAYSGSEMHSGPVVEVSDTLPEGMEDDDDVAGAESA